MYVLGPSSTFPRFRRRGLMLGLKNGRSHSPSRLPLQARFLSEPDVRARSGPDRHTTASTLPRPRGCC